MAKIDIDPLTGRPYGDHGTANDAIEFVLDDPMGAIDHDLYNMEDFLKSWRVGDLEDWPEFYKWLKKVKR